MLTEGMYLADRYEIISKVGAGGMSDVYKAMDHILGRYVAIKVLKQEFSEDRTFVTKFRTEAQSAAGLEHPNIVNIYDVGSEEGLHFIVMEYVEGITLKTYIEKKVQLSFKEAISIAIQVARGIEVAHNKNIIHRDIKPQNIIISTEGKVKVTDFGIARAASANTISSDVMGSVHYASPEQARNGFVDNRSDIYSLGIVMYEMVTGRVPFDGDTTVAVAIQHLQEEMSSPREYAPNIPISLEKIILKCAQKNPDRRYQSMAELLADLRKALVNPNEDFVVIAPLVDNGKTKVISQDELQQIKDKTLEESASGEEDGSEVEEDAAPTKRRFFADDEEEEDEEDEDDGILNPKMDKVVTIMGIVVAVIIVIVIIFFVLSLFGVFKFGKKNRDNTETQTQTQTETQLVTETETEETEVKMITLVGLEQEEAQEALDKMGLTLFVSELVESDRKEGTILSQDIEEGTMVEKGTSVKVTVACAVKEKVVTVPGVVGATEADAAKALDALKLSIEKTYEYSDTVAAGSVISQNPTAGSTLTEGAKVKLVISQGVKSTVVPSVVGKESATAQSEIAAAGLVVSGITEEYHDTIAKGIVLKQSVEGGKTVANGTGVSLVISKGPATVYYSCSYELTVPADATKADITLSDANGNVITSWNKTPVTGGQKYTISKSGITGSSTGKIKVTWYKTVTETDEEGNTTSSDVLLESNSEMTDTVNFTKQ
ncbi:MAG: Stk1 family PASTA domain-containing Ser/Thr kinase [Lachnospiraceae bacterium]|nr:Stk1 family PASTA domain-containing Ser/Thr kinase [Lachnospiraceae bacterium]